MTKGREPRVQRPSDESVRKNILAMLVDTGVDPKELYAEVGIAQPTWSKKTKGRKFTLDELARIADFFAKKKGHPLYGWPFLSYSDSLELEMTKDPDQD
jgi:DNA-binding Xre family transcriptional regulator